MKNFICGNFVPMACIAVLLTAFVLTFHHAANTPDVAPSTTVEKINERFTYEHRWFSGTQTLVITDNVTGKQFLMVRGYGLVTEISK